MKDRSLSLRPRRARRWGAALAVALAGSVVATSASQAASKPSAKAKYGGEITVGMGDAIGQFCVSNIPNHSALSSFRAIYEQLFERTTGGEYVGWLAESGTPNADFTQWTIKIRQGIKFHNGEVLNADSVKLNIDLNSGLYVAQDKTKNADFATGGKGYASSGYGVNANIINVAKVDDYTIRIDLDHSQNDFLGVLYRAGRYIMRAPSQLVDLATGKPSSTCATKPVGTGPYKLVSTDYRDEMIVEKNPEYWKTNPANGDKLPYLDKITFINVKEPSQRAAAVRKGAIDIAMFATADATFVKDLQKRKSQVTVYKAQPLWFGQWVPNVNKKDSPFKFKNCRLAVAYAIDWKAYNRVRLKGMGDVSGSIVTKAHPMFTLKGAPKYDKAKAQEYVAACKTDLGGVDPGWSLYADTSTLSQNNAKFIQKYLEEAGFKMGNIDIAESLVHIASIYSNPQGVTQKTLTQGTPAEGGDSAYVSIFFASSAFPTGHKSPLLSLTVKTSTGADLNVGKYWSKVIALSNVDDPKIDELILAARAAKTKSDSRKKWAAMSEYLMAEGYQIPTVHTTFYTVVNKKSKLGGIGKLQIVKGKTPQVSTNRGFDLTGIWKG